MPTLTVLPQLDPARGYDIRQAGAYLGNVSPPSVYKLIRQNKLASYTIGKRRLVRGSEIARFTAGDPPTRAGEPINETIAAQKRAAGSAGGLAKAARSAQRNATAEQTAA